MRLRISLGVVALAALSGFGSSWLTGDRDQIIFLRVGQGDSTIIRAQGRTIVVDTGPTSDAIDAGSRFVVPALRKASPRLDLIVLTHPDLDHIGGTGAVLKAFPRTPIVANAIFREDVEFNKFLQSWHVNADQIHWLEKPGYLEMGSTRINLVPPPGEYRNDNSGSILMKVKIGNQSAVLTGDAPETTEAWAIGKLDWHADLYKAGHHGSRTSSSEPWLKVISPKLAIVSCGRGNRYGHPAPETLDRFNANGIKVKRTDQDGDICLEPSAQGWADCR